MADKPERLISGPARDQLLKDLSQWLADWERSGGLHKPFAESLLAQVEARIAAYRRESKPRSGD